MKNKINSKIIVVILLFLLILMGESNIFAGGSLEKTISINLDQADLQDSLLMLAQLAEYNIVIDKSVTGVVTLFLKDLTFEEALKLITTGYHLQYRLEKNTIFVATEERMKSLFQNNSQRIIQLAYRKPEEILNQLKEFYPDLKISFDQQNLIVSGDNNLINSLKKTVKKLDLPRKQVMVEARVEEVSRTELKKLGIHTEQLSTLNFIKNDSGQLDKIQLTWPDLLRSLEEQGAAELLANPSLMTLDGKKAKLLIGDQVPVKLETIEDGKTVSTIKYIDAGIVLEFLPNIVANDQIILEVKPSVSSLGQKFSDGLPAINSRNIETTVRLKNGETLAIGGLIKKDILKSYANVPILSQIPLLGRLFSSEEVSEITSEIIIFLTPHIIENDNNHNDNNDYEKREKQVIKPSKRVKDAEIIKNNKRVDFISLTEEELLKILKH